jgi:demethylmenaquinone methyltransferase/2-methoxy-6-polyprenyl-1,4-benzoquinol methylase
MRSSKPANDENCYNSNAVFTSIAERYDFMKGLLSGGQELRWKASLFRMYVPDLPERWLDIATGTGDFFWITPDCVGRLLIGFDRNWDMLQLARTRLRRLDIHWVSGDLNELPFQTESVDLITIGYGLRYCDDIPRFARACHRALRPGGKVFAFDVGHPSPLLRPIWYTYLFSVGTILGTLLHGKPRTYWHLWQSLKRFPGQDKVCSIFEGAGFSRVGRTNVMNGTMFGFYAEKAR